MRIAFLLAAWACLVAAVLARSSYIEARLLRADPDSLPGEAMLSGFGRELGAALFEGHCAGCHGNAGRGDPQRGIPNLTDADWLYGSGSVSGIEEVIKYGIRSYHPRGWNLAIMPAYATAQPSARDARIPALSPQSIRDLVEFLVREQGLHADDAAAARGAALFSGSAGCYDCHAPDAKGDSAIGAPNLADRITLYGDGDDHGGTDNRRSMTLSIAYGRHGMCPSWVRRMAPAEIREAAIYVYSLSHSARGG